MKFPHNVLSHISISNETPITDIVRFIFNKVTFFGSASGICIAIRDASVIRELKAQLAQSPEVASDVKIGSPQEIDEYVKFVKSSYDIIWHGNENISLVRAHQEKMAILLAHLKTLKATAAFLPVVYAHNFGSIHEETFAIRNIVPSFYTTDCNYVDGVYMYTGEVRVLNDKHTETDDSMREAIVNAPFLINTKYMFKSINGTNRINTVPIEYYL